MKRPKIKNVVHPIPLAQGYTPEFPAYNNMQAMEVIAMDAFVIGLLQSVVTSVVVALVLRWFNHWLNQRSK